MVVILAAIAVVGRAFSFDRAQAEALFLSDKMAYELNLSTPQYNAVYEINMDYFLGLGTRDDVYGNLWSQRNYALQRVLTPHQYEIFMGLNYFYRPVLWRDGRWDFRIYRRYQNRHHYFLGRPGGYSNYRGGRHFRSGRGPAPGVRRGLAPRNNFRGPGPGPRNRQAAPPRNNNRNNFRGSGPGSRNRQAAPPRSNNLRGSAPRPDQGRVTRNGMVQRQGGTSRTTVTRSASSNRQQGRQGQQGNRRPQGNQNQRRGR